MGTKKDEILEYSHRMLIAQIKALREIKGGERSERARALAIVITELEKAAAYLKVYVVDA